MLKECQPARLNADMVKLFAYAIPTRDGMQADHQSADLVSAKNFLILIQTKTSLHTIGRQVAITRLACRCARDGRSEREMDGLVKGFRRPAC